MTPNSALDEPLQYIQLLQVRTPHRRHSSCANESAESRRKLHRLRELKSFPFFLSLEFVQHSPAEHYAIRIDESVSVRFDDCDSERRNHRPVQFVGVGVSMSPSLAMLVENRELLMLLTTSVTVLIGCVVIMVWLIWSKKPAKSLNLPKLAKPKAEPEKELDGDKKKVTIFFGTQTGTAEAFAKALAEEAKASYEKATFKVIDLRTGKEPYQSKNLVTERNRRNRIKEGPFALRALVPNISKMDRAAIQGDAIEYIEDLQKTTGRLQAELREMAEEDCSKNNTDSKVAEDCLGDQAKDIG